MIGSYERYTNYQTTLTFERVVSAVRSNLTALVQSTIQTKNGAVKSPKQIPEK
jgi:hypothetical protein